MELIRQNKKYLKREILTMLKKKLPEDMYLLLLSFLPLLYSIELVRRYRIKHSVVYIDYMENYNHNYYTYHERYIFDDYHWCSLWMNFEICDNCGDFMCCGSFQLTETMRHKCKCNIEREYRLEYKLEKISDYKS